MEKLGATENHELPPTLREAIHVYRKGEDAPPQPTSPWEIVWVGFIPVPLPNSESRQNALFFHDLHHVLTGYSNSLHDETQIAAWELGAGCRTLVVAWVINLMAAVAGFLHAPIATWKSYVAGLRAKSLYRYSRRHVESKFLDMRVDDLRALLNVCVMRP